ncbi:MAG: hypothetical protein JXX28_08885 [Deltaproteobacteria bacterium]|nr:hypothetical protein [Deltaproteobacteria bacterium]
MRATPFTTLGLLALTALLACGVPEQASREIGETWDASHTVALQDGIYLRMLRHNALVRVTPDGSATPIDLGEGQISKMLPSPDGTSLVGFVARTTCDAPQDELDKMSLISDCPFEDRVAQTTLELIRDGAVAASLDVPATYNALAWSDTGAKAIAYLDFEQLDANTNLGVMDLTSVMVVDMASGAATPVSVGFAADRILFAPSREVGQDSTSAVVLSQSSVAVIDLSGDTPERVVTFPLTLDPDQRVNPVGVELTPDGQYALISVQGRDDLYVLDLVNHSVNMVSLSYLPTAMAVDQRVDRTVFVYQSQSVADILEHDLFELQSVPLDEPMADILQGDGFALLYNNNNAYYHDLYRLDLETGDLLEYRLQNPILSLQMAPAEDFAIALTRAESGYGSGIEGYYDMSPGMEILDLRDTERARSTPYLLEQPAAGLAFSATETALYALILQQNTDYLYQLDLYTGQATEVDLSAPPLDLGTLADGTFYITHKAPYGLISFYDAATGAVTEVRNFALDGFFDDDLLTLPEVE